MAYVLTRSLGASIGNYMSQAKADGGLDLGTTVTSLIFLATILALVIYLQLTRKDATENAALGMPRPRSAAPRSSRLIRAQRPRPAAASRPLADRGVLSNGAEARCFASWKLGAGARPRSGPWRIEVC
jgi:preprotein translocase subunit SecG